MTLFERIVAREIPADIVYEDDDTIAFRDIHPQAPVHVLIVPKRPIDRLSNATASDQALLGRCMLVVGEVARKLGVSDFRLVVNNGAAAGQSVFHLHLHLLAGRPLGWPPG